MKSRTLRLCLFMNWLSYMVVKLRFPIGEAKKSGTKPASAKAKGSGNRQSVLARLREKQKIVEEKRR